MREIILKDMEYRYEELKEPYQKAMKLDSKSLQTIYQKKPADSLFHPLTPSKDTIFHIAAYMGSKEVLDVLFGMTPVTRREEALMLTNIHGNSILHEAAKSGKKEAAEFLVGIKKEICLEILEKRNKLGETPLYLAAGLGNKEMVEFFKEVGKVNFGDVTHFRRSGSEYSDDLPILHFAVMNQNFETALWLLDTFKDLATFKDRDGKTCLHLLASMPTAFKSSSQKMVHRIKLHIYDAIPVNLDWGKGFENFASNKSVDPDEMEQHQRELVSSNDESSLKNGEKSEGSTMYSGFLKCLNDGWKFVREIRETKRKHLLAVKLAKELIRKDKSWFTHYEPKPENMVLCFTRKMKTEEEKTGEIKTEKGKTWEIKIEEGKTEEPDTPLIVATKSGIKEIVDEILQQYPQAIEYVTKKGENILHVAVLHRQYEIFNGIKEEPVARRRLFWGIDDDADTVLHKAASTKYYHGGTKSTAALKLQEELKWFQDVKNRVPEHYTMHRNKSNFTAEDLFKDQHKEQLKYAQDWVKNTCQSCSAVAVLVATVVYAAAFTAPGGFLETSGQPVLVQRPLYSFFTVMDVTGLATSLTSVVIFLSILTSSLDQHDFNRIIPRKLSLGFTFLFIAVTTTMLSFTATIILTVHLRKRWTTTLTYAAAFLPITVYAVVQFGLYYEYIHSAIISIYELARRLLPGI